MKSVLSPRCTMPRDGRKPVTIDEVTQQAMKSLVNDDELPFDTYDEFCRNAVLIYRDSLQSDLLKAVKDGRKKLDVELPGGVA